MCCSTELSLKENTQYGVPPCTKKFTSVALYNENIIFLRYKTSYTNEEINSFSQCSIVADLVSWCWELFTISIGTTDILPSPTFVVSDIRPTDTLAPPIKKNMALMLKDIFATEMVAPGCPLCH